MPTRITEREVTRQPVFDVGGSPGSPGTNKWFLWHQVLKNMPVIDGVTQWIKFSVQGRTEAYALMASLQHPSRFQSVYKVEGAVRRSGDDYFVWCRMLDEEHWEKRLEIGPR